VINWTILEWIQEPSPAHHNECNRFIDNMLPTEPIGFAEMLVQRKESAHKTLRETSDEELRTLVRELFPDSTHPWAGSFSKFIEEHHAERAVRGETSDGISFVYYPQSHAGIWFENTGKSFAVGLLGHTSLGLLSEIISGTEHSDS
jgi:hypothetical protein